MILAMLLTAALPTMAERVAPEKAQKSARTFFNNNGVKADQLVDLSKTAGFANLYIFNGAQGFVVMAADDCVQPILGYSLEGSFAVEGMPSNLIHWLQGYNDEIQFAIDSKLSQSAETKQQWNALLEGNAKAGLYSIVVAPLVQTHWDQLPYYNNLCPLINNVRAVTGCVATAMAQVMKYWNYPTTGSGSKTYTSGGQSIGGVTYPTIPNLYANFGGTTYGWTNMPTQLNSGSSQTQVNAVATLMFHCGVAVSMQYNVANSPGSSAFPTDIPTALTTYFRYNSSVNLKYKADYSESNWLQLVKSDLNAGMPLVYNGYGDGGHSFICDGYRDDNYFHFNWGWSGTSDGWFALSSLNPGTGGAGGGSYNFTNNQNAVFGIQPINDLQPPTNFSLTTQSRNVILNWDISSGAQSYYVYRDDIMIANTTANTYTDANLEHGTYRYYLKSKYANNQLSNATSTLTATMLPIAANLSVTQQGNGAVLNWTQPTAYAPILTYGTGVPGSAIGPQSYTSNGMYAGHRYPASMLSAGQKITKVSFIPAVEGPYQVAICKSAVGASSPSTWYDGVSGGYSFIVGSGEAQNWYTYTLPSPVNINTSVDLWVFIYHSAGSGAFFAADTGTTNSNGDYYRIHYDVFNVGLNHLGNAVFCIRTYLQDPAYTYLLEDNGVTVANNIDGSSYSLPSIAQNTAHQYTLKTNFHGSLTPASNKAGLTLGTATLGSLNLYVNDKMTVTANSSLAISGAISNVGGPASLVLENGAQLISSSDGVQATVKKDITAYSQNDGWHLVASPVAEALTPTAANGWLANSYDLYAFDQSEALEWRNYEADPKPFSTIDNMTGYLYANSGNTTLTFAGTLANNATPTPLAYDGNASLKGFNLIGNPYPCEAYTTKPFFVLQYNAADDCTDFVVGSGAIAPCEAILVQAQGEGESVSFSKSPTRTEGITIALTQDNDRGSALIDRVRINIGENDKLSKYSLNPNASKLYLTQDGQDLAVACSEGQTELPLSFKAAKNGTYTLTFDTQNLDLDYLHLIDNLTGNDVDLLTPAGFPLYKGGQGGLNEPRQAEYTFTAKTTDYASRFRLVFSEPADETSANRPFAYIADGEIRIVTDGPSTGSGAFTLQVVDMMGRVIISVGGHTRHIPTAGMMPGVYVLRLIDGDSVRTQKIVIE